MAAANTAFIFLAPRCEVGSRPTSRTPVPLPRFPTVFASPMCKASNGWYRRLDITELHGMSVRMPEQDAEILGRRDRIVAALRSIVPGEGVIAGEREMRAYETDGLTAYRQLPMVVVLPETTQQVAE